MCGDQEESDVTNLSWCHSVRPFFTSGEVGLGWERMQSQPSMAPPLQTLPQGLCTGRGFQDQSLVYSVTMEMHFAMLSGLLESCISVAPWGQGPGSLWTPQPHPFLGSGSQGLWEPASQRTWGCSLTQLWGSLFLPPSLQDSQITSVCLDFYRKKLFAGNFSFGPISVPQR